MPAEPNNLDCRRGADLRPFAVVKHDRLGKRERERARIGEGSQRGAERIDLADNIAFVIDLEHDARLAFDMNEDVEATELGEALILKRVVDGERQNP